MLNTAIVEIFPDLLNWLVTDKCLNERTAQTALHHSRENNMTLAHYLVTNQFITSKELFHCCKKYFDILPVAPELLLNQITYDSDIHLELQKRYRILPLGQEHDKLLLGMSDPSDQTALTAVRFLTGLQIKPLLLEEATLEKIFQQTINPISQSYTLLENTLMRMRPVAEPPATIDKIEPLDEPIIVFVNQLLEEAVLKKCSDIHLEPYEHICRIRFRRDGLLYEAASIPTTLSTRVITRLKILAHLNIAERRLPQDGRIIWHYQQQKLDIRINTCPVLFGEKIVLRLLNNQAGILTINKLGMSAAQEQLLKQSMQLPQGMILVTGPTGCGKTITLYAILQALNTIERNISTVEDPVEMELPGINQINIHPRIGLDFPAVLRSLLRQDPDIMMIGEIRDQETASIATQAAQTGHLVLSTLHTNNAIEAISRLLSMGIPAYQLANSLTLIIAQRLVRLRCPYCQQSHGCQHCHDGYQGRTGLFELLSISDTLRHKIIAGNLESTKRTDDFQTLWQSGREKLIAGLTTQAELTRVLGLPDDAVP